MKRTIELMNRTEQHTCEVHYPLTPKELRSIRPGDHVKAGFLMPAPYKGEKYERMWIKIREVDRYKLVGDLANIPRFFPEDQLKAGDEIEVPMEKVLDILHYDKPHFSVMQMREHN